MSKERELLKVAVIALEDAHFNAERKQDEHLRASVIKQIKDVLAQPEQEQDIIDLDQVDKHLEICDKSEDDYINEESGYIRSEDDYINEESGYNRSDWWG